jgi:hypothetical protein
MSTGESLEVYDAHERLIALRRDLAVARNKIREALLELAHQHQISGRHVTYAVDGYADNLLACVVDNVERELERAAGQALVRKSVH